MFTPKILEPYLIFSFGGKILVGTLIKLLFESVEKIPEGLSKMSLGCNLIPFRVKKLEEISKMLF